MREHAAGTGSAACSLRRAGASFPMAGEGVPAGLGAENDTTIMADRRGAMVVQLAAGTYPAGESAP
jgi:hypothetical protein